MTDLTLGAEFPQASREAWLALVDKALKGAAFDEALTSTTYDGLRIDPLYAAEIVSATAEWPGAAPYTRGAHGADGREPAWEICQIIDHPDPAVANRALLEDLERGATAAAYRVATTLDRGVMIATPGDLDTLLAGVGTEGIRIHIQADERSPAVAALLLALADRRGMAIKGCLGLDPIGTLAMTGSLPTPIDRALAIAADFGVYSSCHLADMRALRADTRRWHLAGASDAQEIAVALTTGVAYLRALEAAGLDLEAAAGQIAFTMTADADFFGSIAKLRAARRLWAETTAACGIAPQPMALTVETAARMMTRRDPWVNMLRTTVACFAAGIAGAETVIVQPFSTALGLPDGFARRIARNTQIILQEESNLGRVLDPAGGSWYVEHRTDAVARVAWNLFREIEAEGGIARSMADGRIQDRVGEIQALRWANIARRVDPLTGVSEFAKPDENAVDVVPVDWVSEREAAAQRVTDWVAGRQGSSRLTGLPEPGDRRLVEAMVAAAGQGATVGELSDALVTEEVTVGTLPRFPLGEPFEILRERADAHFAATGNRPQVFLANLGTAAAYTARSTFARNFFGAAGIVAEASPDCLTPEDAVLAWRETPSPIAVLCSSDAIYETHAAETARALQAAGAAHIYLAGNPGAGRESLIGAGIVTFIHVGCSLVDMLDRALTELGVAER